MSSLSDVDAKLPLSHVNVPPIAFSDEWFDRPKSTVCIGLRLVPDTDIQAARAQARRYANEAFPGLSGDNPHELVAWGDTYNDGLMGHILAFGMCDPNNALEFWEPFKAAPEEMTRRFLLPEGKKLVWDKWEAMRIATTPTQREATNEETATIAALLAEWAPRLGVVRTARARRLLGFVLDELESVRPKEG